MKLTPILTEKSLNEAKNGRFTFYVEMGLNKHQIAESIEKAYKVNVISVSTMNSKKLSKKNSRGVVQSEMARKKAIVGLKKDQKIEYFVENAKVDKKK